jgi:hypothetical protein
MPEPLADQILRRIPEVEGLYHRLLIVAAPAGKTAALLEVSKRTGYPRININLELSSRLLEFTERQRSLQTAKLVGEIVASVPGSVALLDNVEILFDVSLKLEPLQCLRNVSRNRTIVVAWNGNIASDKAARVYLSYAEPGHPEFRRYQADDIVYVSPSLPV